MHSKLIFSSIIYFYIFRTPLKMKRLWTSSNLWWSPKSELQDPECPAMDLWGDLQGLRRKSLQGDRRDWPSSGVWLKSHNVRIHLSLKLMYRLSAPFKRWLGHVHKVQVTVGSWGALQLLRQYDPLGVNPFRNTVVWRMVFGVDIFLLYDSMYFKNCCDVFQKKREKTKKVCLYN